MRFFTALLLFCLASGASAQITITSTADTQADDGLCTLREALTSLNTRQASGGTAGECLPNIQAGATTLTLGIPTGSTITLTSDLPVVRRPIVMQGPSPEASSFTLDGDGQYQALAFNTDSDDAPIELRYMTITGSAGMFGGGLTFNNGDECVLEDLVVRGNTSTNSGAGIYIPRDGACTLDRVHIHDNETTGAGGGMRIQQGAAVTIRNSTIENNISAGGGGGILILYNVGNEGAFVLEQSTISGNISLNGNGGGLAIQGTLGTAVIRGSAIVENESRGTLAFAGGVSRNGPISFESTIVADNVTERTETFYRDLSVANTSVSLGGNLIGNSRASDPVFPSGIPNANGDLVGDETVALAPLLGPLADNGGPTPTHLPSVNSPVLDAGICPEPSATSGADQRNSVREIDEPGIANANGDACDIGPVEGTAFTVGAEPLAARQIRLASPAPNPARGSVRIAFETAASGAVSLTVVDLLGREVTVLARGERPAGEHAITLDTAPLAPGVYLVRLATPEASAARRITVVR